MKQNHYTFKVPTLGTIRVNADDLNSALMEVADAAGIQMVGAVQQPKRPALRVIARGSQSPVSES